MEGRYPNGLMFAMTSCKDPAREREFNDWYNHIHLPDVTAPGIYSHATRFANTSTNVRPGEGRYIALYETNWDDLAEAVATERQALDIVRAQGRVTPLIENVLVSTFKRLGGEFRSSSRPVRGVLAVLSNCTDSDREDEFNNWYNDIHIPDVLDTGLYHTAYRFESQDPQATRGSIWPCTRPTTVTRGRRCMNWESTRPIGNKTGGCTMPWKCFSPYLPDVYGPGTRGSSLIKRRLLLW